MTNENRKSITDIVDLYIDSCDIHDLAESLVRSMQQRVDMEDTPQPDLTLAKLVAKAIGDLKEKISDQT